MQGQTRALFSRIEGCNEAPGLLMKKQIMSGAVDRKLEEMVQVLRGIHGFNNEFILSIELKTGDGRYGRIEKAPFDGILVACAPEHILLKLADQLKENGRMVLPVGGVSQKLMVLTRQKDKVVCRDDIAVRFVPMVRENEQNGG